MKRQAFEELLAARLGWPAARLREALHVTAHTLTHQLATGQSVRLPGLGTFRSHQHGPRRWYSALLGGMLLSPRRTVIRFRASQALKDALNRG